MYAGTGLNETTTTIADYEYESNPLIKLSDLPGAGTEKFPLATYAKDMELKQFDAFVLLTKDRFTEADVTIIMEIKKNGKPMFFARTHADVDCQKHAYDNPDTFPEGWEAMSTELKDFLSNEMDKKGVSHAAFHISSLEKRTVDLEDGGTETVWFEEFENF